MKTTSYKIRRPKQAGGQPTNNESDLNKNPYRQQHYITFRDPDEFHPNYEDHGFIHFVSTKTGIYLYGQPGCPIFGIINGEVIQNDKGEDRYLVNGFEFVQCGYLNQDKTKDFTLRIRIPLAGNTRRTKLYNDKKVIHSFPANKLGTIADTRGADIGFGWAHVYEIFSYIENGYKYYDLKIQRT